MRCRKATTPLDLARIASSARNVSTSRAGEASAHRAPTHRAAACSSSAAKRCGRALGRGDR
jgi:hypothetical protein